MGFVQCSCHFQLFELLSIYSLQNEGRQKSCRWLQGSTNNGRLKLKWIVACLLIAESGHCECVGRNRIFTKQFLRRNRYQVMYITAVFCFRINVYSVCLMSVLEEKRCRVSAFHCCAKCLLRVCVQVLVLVF